MKDLKIINGKFPDFENDSWVQADIVIHDGVIEFIGDVPVECENVIDAAGKVVAPGFIDIHAHEDQFVGRHEDDFFTAGRGLLMGVLEMTRTSYITWMKFVGKFLLLIALITIVVLSGATILLY